ncbi:MAG: acyl-CoA dehydrogenase family protein, partial [Janthinobacterium lividum]
RLPVADLSDDNLAQVRDALAETAEEYDRSAELPWKALHVLHDAGFLRLGIGPAYGGTLLTAVDSVRVFGALGAGDPSAALVAAMTVFQHAHQSAAPWWPDELYREVVADSLDRPVLLNAVRAEPEWGAPARGGLPATTVRRTADGWVLDGHKGFATGSEGLAYHLVWAATDEADPLLAHAIVPAGSPGIRIEKTWDHLGMRATSTHDVIYDGVEIGAENFRGTRHSQLPREPPAGSPTGLAVAALYVGIGRAAQRFFVRFAHERVPTSLGRPIASTERIQTVAGEIEAQLVGAEELLLGLATRFDTKDPDAGRRAGVAKLLSTRAAIAAVQTALAAIGNPGLTRHHPLERHFRDVQGARPHPPQDDAALLLAGRRSLDDLKPDPRPDLTAGDPS